MASLATTFTGAVDDVATTANTGFDNVTTVGTGASEAPVFVEDTGNPLGSSVPVLRTSITSAYTQLAWDVPSAPTTGTHYFMMVVKITTVTDHQWIGTLFRAAGSPNRAFSSRLRNNGDFESRSGNSAAAGAVLASWPQSQWNRVEWAVNLDTDTQELRSWNGANVLSTGAADQSDATGTIAGSGALTNVNFGFQQAESASEVYLAAAGYSDTDWVGPPATTVTQYLDVLDSGGTLRPATTLSVWDGAPVTPALRPVTIVQEWDGSTLRPVILP